MALQRSGSMSHITHDTYEYIMSHICISRVTHMNESYDIHEWGSHVWTRHVTNINASCHTYEYVISRVNESGHTHECIVSQPTLAQGWPSSGTSLNRRFVTKFFGLALPRNATTTLSSHSSVPSKMVAPLCVTGSTTCVSPRMSGMYIYYVCIYVVVCIHVCIYISVAPLCVHRLYIYICAYLVVCIHMCVY